MSRWSKAATSLMLRDKQHAVAEHVAGHVADARDRHRLALDVDVHLAEMPLHGLPGAARRDAHLLVVVALAAAGCEGVAEPGPFSTESALAVSEKVAVPLSAATTR